MDRLSKTKISDFALFCRCRAKLLPINPAPPNIATVIAVILGLLMIDSLEAGGHRKDCLVRIDF